ncbi:molybdopterin molybdotransferase MoeA [Botrimarina colliarenosi]|uniref:molybdopterin molybdotransferase MoeA n=1 Tax=Botrimarina colliarenosi TaxID=2528001 RepID=UPI0018D28CB0|nr:molybdopterin molybdotransferase MoeA [Botrimarina colliarenosi]
MPPLEPAEAIQQLTQRLAPIGVETVATSAAAERVLADPILLDRDSPACDCSAMDGFAVRAAELAAGALPVVGECRIGEPPGALPAHAAMRIYTGSPLPRGADAVIRLERVDEAERVIRLQAGTTVTTGEDLRRRAENAAAGDVVVDRGVELTAASIAAAATVGLGSLCVHRSLRLGVVTTGSELERPDASDLPPWRLRDSNGPALAAMFGGLPWIDSVELQHADDSLEELTTVLAESLQRNDAVVLTGGVSKGAYDYVPDAVRSIGGEVVFYRIRARPGQPTLGAVAGEKAIVGLPGNPLAVLTAGRRVLTPVLRRLAGHATIESPTPQVTLEAWSGKTLPLTWWRPVRLNAQGVASLASLRGSGDVCGPAATDGFIEVPADTSGVGPYPYYAWRP